MTGFATRVLVSGVLLVSASAGWAQTGSGSVNFEFLSFRGPVQRVIPPANPGESPDVLNSLINNQVPSLTGQSIPVAPGAGTVWNIGGRTFDPGTTSAVFGYTFDGTTTTFQNVIAFAPTTFSNVARGQNFTLGTFTFQNGGWFGGAGSSVNNVTSLLPFRIWTTSNDGPQFNQQRFGIVTLTVNIAPNGFDPTQYEAEADWITVFMGDDPTDSSSWTQVADFRVYDSCCLPSGFTDTGTVDLVGAFGSLNLVGLSNPRGGFIVGNNNPLVPGTGGGDGNGGGVTPGVIPEPATWAMMIAGFGLVGGVMRRRRVALAA